MIQLKKIKASTFLRMAAYIKPYAPKYLTALFCISIMNFLQSFLFSMGLKYITNQIFAKNMSSIVYISLLMFAVICVLALLDSYCVYQVYAKYREIGGDLRKDIFSHIELLPMRFVEDSHSGDFLSRINNDIWHSMSMLGDPISGLLGAIISGTLSGITIFCLNWELGLIALVFGLLTTVVNLLFMGPIKKMNKTVREKISDIFQIMTDTVMGSQVIKIFNLQRSFVEKFKKATADVFNSDMKVAKYESYLDGFNSFGGFMNYVGIIVIGSILVLYHRTDFATLVAVIPLVGTFFSLFRRIGYITVRINGCLASADRLFEIMDEPDEERLHREKRKNKAPECDAADNGENAPVPVIELKNVSFCYKERKTVLDNFSLDVFKNQVVAVVGSSGSGKSTLFKILLGYYEPDSGNISFFGKSSYDYELPELRKLIAYVPQDNYLFSGSIRDNISWGKENATDEEIIEVAKSAYAHDFIMKLPDGYNTEVGERGARLSGGERQRIAIARALLKDAPILLLDEATSSLDSESEQQVQKALEVLMEGRTTMVIAHRLSTIQHADRIIVLENGSISEDGTHTSLIEKNGVYAYLYNLQFAVNKQR